jgi:hypothetical protein
MTNFIEHLSLLTIISLGILFLLVIIIASWYIAGLYFKRDQRAKRQEKEYDKAYHRLEDMIQDCKMTALSEALVKCELKKIALMPGNDREKTGKLTNDYLRKFYGVSEDEFSPGQLDHERVSRELKLANESRLL